MSRTTLGTLISVLRTIPQQGLCECLAYVATTARQPSPLSHDPGSGDSNPSSINPWKWLAALIASVRSRISRAEFVVAGLGGAEADRAARSLRNAGGLGFAPIPNIVESGP